MSEFNIVIVDDQMDGNGSFVQIIKKNFTEAAITLYKTVEEAVEYIMSTLDTRTVVFLDCSFDEGGEQGIDGLAAIREKTSLVSVVMMSGNPLMRMKEEDLMSMINADNLYFIKNTNTKGAVDVVRKIQMRWRSQLDCLLEQWVLNHNTDERDKPYIATPGGTLSLNDVLKEIRNKTGLGITMERNILQVAIDALTREKKKQ